MAGTTDTVKAKLTPGEFVIRKEAVDMIGVPMLNKLNDMPEEGGHSAIDSLIQRATLANMKMMYGGGMVQPNYAGGGMVEEKMQGYQNGGMALRMAPDVTPDMDYVNVDYDFDPRLNQYGDEVFNPVIEQAENQANELARIKDSLYLFGQGKNPTEDRASLLAFLSKDEDDLSTREATLKRKFERVEDDLESARIKSQRKSAEDLYAYDRGVRTREMQRALESGEVPYSDLFEEKNLREVQGLLKQIKKTGTFKQGLIDYRKKQRAKGYQQGGLAGYENGGEAEAPKYQKYLARMLDTGGNRTAYANPQDSTVFYQDNYQPFIYDRMGRLSGFVDDEGGRHFHTTDELFEAADELSKKLDFNYRNIGQLENRYLDVIGEGQKYSDFTFPGRQPRRGQSNEQAMENLLPAHPVTRGGGMGYQQGGMVNYQNGGPVNQMPEMLSQQAEALQSGMDQDTTNRARKALQYIKIQTLMNDPTLSKQSYTEFEGEAPSEVADIAKHFYSTVRDSANARALRGMQGHSSGYSPSIYGPR
tara:strand:+ start:682 stop:2277 length:1596 start_codon:yes stop_codon:yes gene_type:complete